MMAFFDWIANLGGDGDLNLDTGLDVERSDLLDGIGGSFETKNLLDFGIYNQMLQIIRIDVLNKTLVDAHLE